MLKTNEQIEQNAFAEESEQSPIKQIKLPKNRTKIVKQIKELNDQHSKTIKVLKTSSELPSTYLSKQQVKQFTEKLTDLVSSKK